MFRTTLVAFIAFGAVAAGSTRGAPLDTHVGAFEVASVVSPANDLGAADASSVTGSAARHSSPAIAAVG